MSYIIIKIPITEKGNYAIASFDKDKFAEENLLNLSSAPVSFEAKETEIVLVFEGKERDLVQEKIDSKRTMDIMKGLA